jgi:TM2 domain-containing membrane protein YozV/predicted RNA-binding Zn-ribbon protein involved in translation (DUF1610 family)
MDEIKKREKNFDEIYCSSCGEIIKKEAEICPKCGVRQKNNNNNNNSSNGTKSKVVAGVLAIFLGGIGAHKFYLGDVGVGILYLCFSWTFIPSLLGLIEGILYLTKTNAAFKAKYG